MLEAKPTLIASTSDRCPIGALLTVIRCHIAAIPCCLRRSPAILTGPAVQAVAPVGQNPAIQTAAQVDRDRDWAGSPLLLTSDPATPIAYPTLRDSLLDGQYFGTLPRARMSPRRLDVPLLTVDLESYPEGVFGRTPHESKKSP